MIPGRRRGVAAACWQVILGRRRRFVFIRMVAIAATSLSGGGADGLVVPRRVRVASKLTMPHEGVVYVLITVTPERATREDNFL